MIFKMGKFCCFCIMFSTDTTHNYAVYKGPVFTDHMPIQIRDWALVSIRQPGSLILHSLLVNLQRMQLSIFLVVSGTQITARARITMMIR